MESDHQLPKQTIKFVNKLFYKYSLKKQNVCLIMDFNKLGFAKVLECILMLTSVAMLQDYGACVKN